jgi:catechol 2,3-dioxygenase-like lactoylglutathione lyase family enzyme
MKRMGVLIALACALAAHAQTRPAITGVAYVRFYSSDLAKSDAFYDGLLGLKRVMGADGIARYGFNDSQWLELEKLPALDPGTRLVEIAFTTRNLPQMKAYLLAHHVSIVAQRRHEIRVHDPEGYLIGFVQEGSMHGKLRFTSRAPSQRLIHAGFIVHDRAKEDTFYRDLLGFHIYWERGTPDELTHPVAMQVPDGSDWVEYMRDGGPSPSARARGSMDHISLGVSNMKDAIAVLARNGCVGVDCTKTRTGRDGKVQLNLFDPDLTRMELMEFKPSAPVCCTGILGRTPGEIEDK